VRFYLYKTGCKDTGSFLYKWGSTIINDHIPSLRTHQKTSLRTGKCLPPAFGGEIADRCDDCSTDDDLLHPVVIGDLVQEDDMTIRDERLTERFIKYRVDETNI
jgi:hypothetical protein